MLAAFLGARDAESTRDAVTAAVIDADLDVAAFALVTWAPHLHVVVMGAIDVETDAPSLPLLSGATSRTWVEHGVPGVTGAVVVASGSAPDGGTAVGPGVVRAGGFRLTTTAGRAAERPPSPARTGTSRTGGPGGGAVERRSAARPSHRRRLDGRQHRARRARIAPRRARRAGAGPRAGAHRRADGPGRRCPSGHPNPPSRATCQRCGDLVDLTAPVVDVPQPVLAELVGDDGTAMPIRGPIIVGRNPDPAAAGLDDDAERLVLPERAGVSRTHVVVSADGWTITATDCGSRRGTELARPGADAVRLEPWTAHEVQIGDELFLGGPTSISVSDAGDSSPSPP